MEQNLLRVRPKQVDSTEADSRDLDLGRVRVSATPILNSVQGTVTFRLCRSKDSMVEALISLSASMLSVSYRSKDRVVEALVSLSAFY
jgi:hypothetical protein